MELCCTDNLALGTTIKIGLLYTVNDEYYDNHMLRNFLYGILASIMIVSFWVLVNADDCTMTPEKLLRLLAIAFGMIIFVLKSPYIFLGGSAYYEIPSLYIEETLKLRSKSILMMDAGYWPLSARLLVFLIQLFIRNQLKVVL